MTQEKKSLMSKSEQNWTFKMPVNMLVQPKSYKIEALKATQPDNEVKVESLLHIYAQLD